MSLSRKGFTLIELLITIAIIAIISAVVFIAVDPITRFQEAQESRRLEDLDAIVQAIRLYQVDHGGHLPSGVDNNWRMLGTDNAGCDIDCAGITPQASCLDLSNTLATYLPRIPKDPKFGSDEQTYYAVSVDDRQIQAISCFTGQVGSLPLYSEYPGSTDFTSVPDLTAVNNMILANAHGSITFPVGYTVDASGEDYDSNVQIGEGLISVNLANLDPSFDHEVSLTLHNVTCPTDIYWSAGNFASSTDVINNGALCNAGTDPSCTNITCNGDTLTFTAEHFSSYAVPMEDEAPEVCQENEIEITESIVLDRDYFFCGDGFRILDDSVGIVFDCDGHMIQGSDTGKGIMFGQWGNLSNITVQNCIIDGFSSAIYASNPSNNDPDHDTFIIKNNTITSNVVNSRGINLARIDNALIEGNTITLDVLDGNAETGIQINGRQTSGQFSENNTIRLNTITTDKSILQFYNGAINNNVYYNNFYQSTNYTIVQGDKDNNIFDDESCAGNYWDRLDLSEDAFPLDNPWPGDLDINDNDVADCSEALEGLVSYWNFDDNLLDQEGNNDATAQGTEFEEGVLNNALHLDNSTDYIDIPLSEDLQIVGDLSISFWTKLDSISSRTFLVYSRIGEDEEDNTLYELQLESNGDVEYKHEYAQGSNVQYIFDANFVADTFYHIALVREAATSEVRLYINGEELDSFVYANAPTGGTLAKLYIGSDYAGTSAAIDGIIDEVYLYNSIRSSEEILQEYNDTKPNLAALGYINIDFWESLSGLSIADLTSNNNYPYNPDSTSILTSLEFSAHGDYYGSRMRGFIFPPETGEYTFYIASDDNSQLYFSNDQFASHKNLIASVPAWTVFRDWDDYAEQSSNPISLQAGEKYYFEVLHKEGDDEDHVSVAWITPSNANIQVIVSDFISPYTQLDEDTDPDWRDPIQVHYWNNIGNVSIATLKARVDYPDAPHSSALITSFEVPQNIGNAYGARVEALLEAPETGEYTFYIASDDYGELWLSSDSNEANKSKIAEVPGWTTYQLWTKYPSQHSIPITLQAGQRYYIEGIFQEGYGGDHMSVAWTRPGEVDIEVISGEYLYPL
ncbi:prepilin-type N-terminal cleavage/methylation domain-containing protein [Patescibacteria group bacterium]|nr:prepilin-type N-terminal cleavage/methylation domain-containing protein [Patescibacteria group bacterium]MBU1721937.1 prepilin-type N-terminal cleavage/methylation domain-containing protein [Patescibacteria group bacterium]MBU1901791.1 prepilin-type N-terminal cleavage/methylation domain-containing protein [Patescibacteria group bacterium]